MSTFDSALPPQPGDQFRVPGRRDLITVGHLIAAFTPEQGQGPIYLVQSPAGARWLIAENTADDGPRWIGRPVPADTTAP